MDLIGRISCSTRRAWARHAGTILFVVLAILAASTLTLAQTKTITLSMVAGSREDVLRANLPDFETKTGIKVVVDSAPFGDLYKKQLLSLSTGARYDAVYADEPWIPPLSEFLLPLDERMKGIDVQDFIPATLAAGSFEGKQFALPVDPNVQILVYRKDLFDQKGLKPPATWEELLQVAKTFHDPGKQQYGIAITGSSDLQTALYLTLVMWSYGAEIIDAQGRAGVNTEAARKGAEVFMEMLKYTPPEVKSYTFAEVNKAIQLGQAAMAIQWASGAKAMEDPTRSSVAGKLGYALMPKGTRYAPMRGVWTVAVAKNSPNQEAAWEFAKWLSGREYGLAAAKFPAAAAANHSPRVSVLQDPGTKAALPYADALLENLKVAKGRPRMKEYSDIQEYMRITTSKLAAGSLSPDAALKEMETGINKILQK